MNISNVLEHWASIYKPLSHNPESEQLSEQSFFRIRYIDLENVFSRNANIIHSPCMLQSVTGTGELRDTNKVEVSHQVWLLAKVKDTMQSLGRFDGLQLEQSADGLREHCEDLVSWLLEVKRTGTCPITGRSFREDAQTLYELQAIDAQSISYGVLPDIYLGKWLVAGVDWKSIKPLYRFGCNNNGKYITTADSVEP